MDLPYDKNNYSSKTIETYEIMAAYFVDIFYNHLYNEATKLKINGSCSSITEGYKHALNAFIKGLNNAKLYKKYIVGIHHYYITVGFASISFSKCVDRVTQEFIPIDYFNSLTSTQKMGVLRMILTSSLKQFITFIVTEYLTKIIDFHKEKDNARILQDTLINCFILEREAMYQRFITSQTNDNTNINSKLMSNMQNEIKKLVFEKLELKKKCEQLTKLYLIKKENENKQKELICNLHEKIDEYEKKIQDINNSKLQEENDKNLYETNNLETYNNIEYNNSALDDMMHFATETNIKQTDTKLEETSKIKSDAKSDAILDKKSEENKTNYKHKKSNLSNIDTSDLFFDNEDNEDNDKEDHYIEVNTENLENLINNGIDSESKYNSFNESMETETTLDDFN